MDGGQGLAGTGMAARMPSCGILHDTALLLQFCNGEFGMAYLLCKAGVPSLLSLLDLRAALQGDITPNLPTTITLHPPSASPSMAKTPHLHPFSKSLPIWTHTVSVQRRRRCPLGILAWARTQRDACMEVVGRQTTWYLPSANVAMLRITAETQEGTVGLFLSGGRLNMGSQVAIRLNPLHQ